VVAPLIRSRTALGSLPSHRLTRVVLTDPLTGRMVDDALCTVMRAPSSYTGEDTVEISCHGSPTLAAMLLERLIQGGARLAEPGEFTRRAFVNGRLDLAQAEAVALLIAARTERAVALAARGIAGDLSRRLEVLREELLVVIASLEVVLDFPEEVSAPENPESAHDISRLLGEAGSLVRGAKMGRAAQAGVTIAIVGPPNAGKSSLFNALLGRDRAIVTPQAGTTRDVIEGTIVVGGTPVRLMDTAGLGEPRDHIDEEGMRRARAAMAESDVLLVVLDGSQAPDRTLIAETQGLPHIVVFSKSDLGTHPNALLFGNAVLASVKTEDGLDALLSRLRAAVAERAGIDGDESAIAVSVRQVEILQKLEDSLRRSELALVTAPTEIALLELKVALEAVCELLGLDVGDAVLDTVFSKFCVGK
jgi:tRNA modification GTPase